MMKRNLIFLKRRRLNIDIKNFVVVLKNVLIVQDRDILKTQKYLVMILVWKNFIN